MIRAGTRMPSLYVAGNSQTVSEIFCKVSVIAMASALYQRSFLKTDFCVCNGLLLLLLELFQAYPKAPEHRRTPKRGGRYERSSALAFSSAVALRRPTVKLRSGFQERIDPPKDILITHDA